MERDSKNGNITGWWCNNHLEKYGLSSMGKIIPYGKMFQTTNHIYIYIYIWDIYVQICYIYICVYYTCVCVCVYYIYIMIYIYIYRGMYTHTHAILRKYFSFINDIVWMVQNCG